MACKADDGDVGDKTGGMVNYVFEKPAAAGKVHYRFTVVGGGALAKMLTRTRASSYHLVGKYKKDPGCLPAASMRVVQGRLI